MPEGLAGAYFDNKILIDKYISHRKSVEVLAEEIGHHYTSYGDISDYTKTANMKQEIKARRYGHDLVISLDGIIAAWRDGVHNLHEMAVYFEVTETYIVEALTHYKQKHGLSTFNNGYLIVFEPLNVYEYNKL